MWSDEFVTIDFLEISFHLTDTLFEHIIGEQVIATRFMEKGTLSEFRGEADPESFSQAFEHLAGSLSAIDVALEDYDRLLPVLEADPGLDVFQEALGNLLSESQPFARISISSRGLRIYEDAGFTELYSLMQAQREDLEVFGELTAQSLEQFQEVLPFTENGEFVRTMLAGEHPFSDTFENMVAARSTFSHFYTRSCMLSVQAVMDIYPAGFEFLDG